MKAPSRSAVQGEPGSSPRVQHVPRGPPASDQPTARHKSPVLASYTGRRPIVWAAGFAVIVITGSILGAQLKSRQQAQEKRRLQDLTSPSNLEIKKTISGNSETSSRKPAPNSAELAKQITFLEERRGALLSQKLGLQQKLEEVERKQRVEQEMQARRKKELDMVR